MTHTDRHVFIPRTCLNNIDMKGHSRSFEVILRSLSTCMRDTCENNEWLGAEVSGGGPLD